MASVTLEHVDKTYSGNVHAVKDVQLEILDQEFLVLLGPSGCGKTTLLRMIAGLESISAGAIYIGDRMVNYVPPKDRDIAMVFQNYALYPHMDVDNNITLGLRLHDTPKHVISERMAQASAILGLDALVKRMPRQLSGGQQQRVALGRAIVREPKVFLMDEPLSNLDARLRLHMRTELIKLHRRMATTFIYVTHDQSEAMTMATRIAIMRDGILQQCAAPLQIYDRPVNKYVASFMGSPEMNFLPVTISADGGRACLVGKSFRLSVPPLRSEALSTRRDGSVWLGIRPEAIGISHDLDTPDAVPATIDVIEHLGGHTLVYTLVDDQTIIADVSSDVPVAVGDRVALQFNPQKIYTFDTQTEQALW
jgi:multiple sugar transport system ATP-binding protein